MRYYQKKIEILIYTVRRLDKNLAVLETFVFHNGKPEAMSSYNDDLVMSLAIAASQAKGDTSITTAEAAAVTAPEFEQMMQSLGAKITPQNI